MHVSPAPSAPPSSTIASPPVAGVVGGVVAGAAYLVAQVSFSSVAGRGSAAPVQRIAAMLLGPDAAPPPVHWNFTMFGMALIIHFGLAMVYGRLIGTLVWKRRPGAALLAGAAIGVGLFLVNFGALAPLAFPWFAESLRLATLVDHMLFGAIAAAVCVVLRDRSRPLQR